jgi:hypothetical protein
MKMGYLEFRYCKMNNSGSLKSSCGVVWNLWIDDPEDEEGAIMDIHIAQGTDTSHKEWHCSLTFVHLSYPYSNAGDRVDSV